jgi:hypothetical protein
MSDRYFITGLVKKPSVYILILIGQVRSPKGIGRRNIRISRREKQIFYLIGKKEIKWLLPSEYQTLDSYSTTLME